MIALAGGKPAVVEYSEISNEMAEATDKKGNLLFGASHICVNYFSLSFLRHFCEERLTTLPLHVAKKKIPYTRSPDGKRIHPTSPNGIKLELFIFDTFPHAKRMAALMVPREDEFAPVKNAKGSDSPDTARDLIYSLSSRRLKAAGATIKPKVNQTAEMANELIHQFENLGKGVESLIMRSGMTTPPPGSAAAPASTTTAENGGGTMPAMTAAAAAAQRETMQAMAACLPGGGNGKGPAYRSRRRRMAMQTAMAWRWTRPSPRACLEAGMGTAWCRRRLPRPRRPRPRWRSRWMLWRCRRS